MAEIPPEVIDKIHRFIKEVKKYNINISKAVLFGSYAKGNYNEWSDIDLAVVSEDFEGIRYLDNCKMTKAKLAVSYDISSLPYRPEDFTPDDLFVKEILQHGINIKLS